MTLLDWEQRKLGDVVKAKSGWSPSEFKIDRYQGILFIKVDDLNNSQREQDTSKWHVYENRNYPKIKKLSTIFPKRSAAILTNKVRILSQDCYMDTNIMALEPEKIEPNFLYSFIEQTGLFKIADTSTIPQINNKHINPYKLWIPYYSEQKKIANLLKIVDNIITLQQRKLEQLTLLKKAMLQQILTTNDYPKIRFSGFTNVWEQRRLEKMAKITTGKLDANAMVKNGKYDFYTSGIKKFKINTAAFEGPAITIAGNGATVGYMHLADGKFNAYQRTYVLNQFTVNRLFLFYSVKKVLPRSIYQSARTGNIPYIVLNMITDLKINIPKEKEQKKIGELFTEIQAILINQKNRLRCIKDLKQYLLQNIFL